MTFFETFGLSLATSLCTRENIFQKILSRWLNKLHIQRQIIEYEYRFSTQYVHHNYKVSGNSVSQFQRSCADQKKKKTKTKQQQQKTKKTKTGLTD